MKGMVKKMINLIKWIILLVLWNSILFFEKKLGISVILFIIPLILFIYYSLKINNKIKNKKGLLFIIPIILLSLTYTLFDNAFFKVTNAVAIPILFILMYIYTMKPTFNIKDILGSFISIIIKPLSRLGNIYHIMAELIKKNIKLSQNTKKTIKSVVIIIPIVLIVLLLLSSADQMFSNIFTKLFSLSEKISLSSLIGVIIRRLIPMIIIFFYLSATINFLLYNYSKIKHEEKETNLKIDSLTIKLLLTTLNIIYIVFDIIQIKSLLLHQVSMNISYAEYAREGFFQLMVVSFINLIIVLVSKNIEKKQDEKNIRYIKVMNLIMVFLTLIIIISSFIRMYMYESEYGYTLLRLLTYITLITEVILLIPTIIYITNSKFNIVKHYIIILISIYTIINFINIDYIIAYRNVNRYFKKEDIDIYYLMNNHTDNIPVLIDLYNETEDLKIKQTLKNYFSFMKKPIKHFQEFNVSKVISNKKIDLLND